MKDLRTELYQGIYSQPIYPKNLYLDHAPYQHDEYARKVNRPQVKLMHDRKIWARPARAPRAASKGTRRSPARSTEQRRKRAD